MNVQQFKVILLGDENVGKSSLIQTYVSNVYPRESKKFHWTTTPASKLVTVDGKTSALTIHEIENRAGDDIQYLGLYNTGCDAAIIVFDVSERASFENIPRWINISRDKCVRNVVYMIVAAKNDRLDRQVTTHEGKTFADSNNYLYTEVSAKKYENLDECFQKITLALQVHTLRIAAIRARAARAAREAETKKVAAVLDMHYYDRER